MIFSSTLRILCTNVWNETNILALLPSSCQILFTGFTKTTILVIITIVNQNTNPSSAFSMRWTLAVGVAFWNTSAIGANLSVQTVTDIVATACQLIKLLLIWNIIQTRFCRITCTNTKCAHHICRTLNISDTIDNSTASNSWVSSKSSIASTEWSVVDCCAFTVLTTNSIQTANILTLVVDTRQLRSAVSVLDTFHFSAFDSGISSPPSGTRADRIMISHHALGTLSTMFVARIDTFPVFASSCVGAIVICQTFSLDFASCFVRVSDLVFSAVTFEAAWDVLALSCSMARIVGALIYVNTSSIGIIGITFLTETFGFVIFGSARSVATLDILAWVWKIKIFWINHWIL